MKLELGYFGGNMQALEGKYKGFQVLITDGDGGVPLNGTSYSVGIFQKEDGEWSYEAIKRIDRKSFNIDRAITQAKKLINSLKAK
jgi:hypothetical protein